MTTNLLIAYPSVLREATSITSTASYTSDRPLKNIVTGGRQNTARVFPGKYKPIISIEMSPGNEKPLEYVIVAKAKLLSARGANVFYVTGQTPGAETNLLGTLSNLSSRTYMGPLGEDLIFTADVNNQFLTALPSTAARVFRVFYGTDATPPPEEAPYYFKGTPYTGLRNPDANNLGNQFWIGGYPATEHAVFTGFEGAALIEAQWEFSKLYMGMFFDMGRDPLYPRTVFREVYGRASERRPHRVFQMQWKGITSAKVQEFEYNVVRYKDVSPVFLYTRDHHELLNGDRLVHAYIRDFNYILQHPNSNSVNITFEELI